jgi:hypothetical protein
MTELDKLHGYADNLERLVGERKDDVVWRWMEVN